MNPKFKNKSQFKYVIVKVILELIMCLIGLTLNNTRYSYLICSLIQISKNQSISNCILKSTYIYQLLIFIFYAWFNYLLMLWIAVNEVVLIYNRYLILKKKNIFFDKNFKSIITISGIIIFIFSLPVLYSFTIKSVPLDEIKKYYSQKTTLGNNIFFAFSYLIINNIFNCIISIMLITLSCLLIKEFRIFIRTNKRKNYNLIHKTEIKLIKMTIVINILFLISRLLGSSNFIMYFLISFKLIKYKTFYFYLANFNLIIIYLIKGSNFFVLIKFNREFERNFRKIFCLFIFKFKFLTVNDLRRNFVIYYFRKNSDS